MRPCSSRTGLTCRSLQSNQLAIPFRKATQISLSSAIRQYIAKKYDQHPDMFREELEVIDELRRDAVNTREGPPQRHQEAAGVRGPARVDWGQVPHRCKPLPGPP